MKFIQETINKIGGANQDARAIAMGRLNQLVMPHWALGRLMDLAADLAAMTGSQNPPVSRKTVCVFAGDHGVTAEGVSQYPKEVTAQMILGFLGGHAGVNALAKLNDTRVIVIDAGVDSDMEHLGENENFRSKKIRKGTSNIACGPAMSQDEAVKSITAGIEIANEFADSTDIFGTGDMGIGNTTPSTAIIAALSGNPVEGLTGRGTGIDDERLKMKIDIVKKALEVNKVDSSDGMDVLTKLGGFEIGGITGLILGAAAQKKPVLIDGFISTAGALVAKTIKPEVADYMITSHQSVEPGHELMLSQIGKPALLNLNMRLGEGTGSVLAMNIVEAAAKVLTEVATFEEIGVSGADK
jgi:nicotinate-nucleotide--dimethylbenzimidazole phosphoribosyltransferase